jgi:dCMP deaminase
MYIGVAGLYCAGKDSVAENLINSGFGHLSLSDAVRKEMKKAGVKITRENLISFANEMRVKEGEEIWAKKVVEEIEKNDLNNVVITSIRSPAEVKELEKLREFILVSVEAPLKIRFERSRLRNRENEPSTLKEFKEKENFERYGKKNQQNIEPVIKKAKIHILNDKGLEELKVKVEQLLDDLRKNQKRPGWDYYFMDIVNAISKRATCDRGKTATVIVKDKRILCTGYVGSPIGLEHCDEAGHLFETRYDANGNKKQHCIRTVHGEQNAIAQAAKYGISIDGATAYMKMTPCFVCAKMMINAGIKRVVCLKKYHADELSRKFLKEAGLQLDILDDKLVKYDKQ